MSETDNQHDATRHENDDALIVAIERVAAESGFSGALRIDRRDRPPIALAFGWADRANQIANTIDTRFATASATKGLTGLAVMRLVEQGVLSLATTARSLLGDDLPLIDDAVTVEQLLSHRSGIGDYLDEEAYEITDYVMRRPVHELDTTEAFLPLLDGFPMVAVPGEQFAYNNGAFVVLALLIERATGQSYHDVVQRLVIEPGGLAETAFLRSDELPVGAARGYLYRDGPRTNIFHLPVRGNGDGGVYTTVADVHRLFHALADGSIVSPATAAEMTRPRSHSAEEEARYGLGFWLGEYDDSIELRGYDAGVSFHAVHQPSTGTTYSIIANWTDGAWPLARLLTATFAPAA